MVAEGVDPARPTLVLTECLLIYMTADDSNTVLNWVNTFFTGDKGFLNFEMIKPDD